MLEASLLVTNIGQLVTVRGSDAPRTGGAMSELGVQESGAVAALGGRIVAVGSESEVLKAVSTGPETVKLDAILIEGDVVEDAAPVDTICRTRTTRTCGQAPGQA